MHWQKAILSSPSKRAARQNKYAVYVRYADGSAVVLPKKHSGTRDAKPQEVEGFDDWVSLEEYEAVQQSFAVDGATCSECGGSNGGHYVTCSQVF